MMFGPAVQARLIRVANGADLLGASMNHAASNMANSLGAWLGEQPFAPSYWAYTFGIAAATVSGLKLALAGVAVAQTLSIPVFIGANLFIGYLALRTAHLFLTRKLLPLK